MRVDLEVYDDFLLYKGFKMSNKDIVTSEYSLLFGDCFKGEINAKP